MCCNLQTHVKVIAIICLILTGLGALNLIGTFGTVLAGGQQSYDIGLIYGGNAALALAVQILIYSYWIIAEVCCLIGAIKNNKCLLIPFMISQVLTMIIIAGLGILFIFLGSATASALSSHRSEYGYDNGAAAFGSFIFFIFLIPLLIALGLTIYFFTIVVKFYNELSRGITSGQRQGMVLQPYNAPQGVPPAGGVSTVYVPPGTQNVTYAYQQQPVANAYPQQGYAYPPNNPGVKSSV